jgi:hypothetical protein
LQACSQDQPSLHFRICHTHPVAAITQISRNRAICQVFQPLSDYGIAKRSPQYEPGRHTALSQVSTAGNTI